MKNILKKLIIAVLRFIENHKMLTYSALAFGIILFVLSFVMDIGYILIVLVVGMFLIYSKRISQQADEVDVLNLEKNKERINIEKEKLDIQDEILILKHIVAQDPLNFDASKRLRNLEIKLKALNEKKLKKF